MGRKQTRKELNSDNEWVDAQFGWNWLQIISDSRVEVVDQLDRSFCSLLVPDGVCPLSPWCSFCGHPERDMLHSSPLLVVYTDSPAYDEPRDGKKVKYLQSLWRTF